MGQEQHYLPQAYLRQWSGSDKRVQLLRRLTSPDKLLHDRKSTRSFGFEEDLYVLVEGTQANNRTGRDIEDLLNKKVDSRIRDIVTRASAHEGLIVDEALIVDLSWLLKTFVVRDPSKLAAIEGSVVETLREQRVTLDRMIEDVESRGEGPCQPLRQFRDSRMPSTFARAALVAVVERKLGGKDGWIEGDVHVLHARSFEATLRTLGTDSFITFDQPAVTWGDNDTGIDASFTLSPELLVVVTTKGRTPEHGAFAITVENHLANPLSSRRMVISREKLTGVLLELASRRLLSCARI